jgi:hypothetical protein
LRVIAEKGGEELNACSKGIEELKPKKSSLCMPSSLNACFTPSINSNRRVEEWENAQLTDIAHGG